MAKTTKTKTKPQTKPPRRRRTFLLKVRHARFHQWVTLGNATELDDDRIIGSFAGIPTGSWDGSFMLYRNRRSG